MPSQVCGARPRFDHMPPRSPVLLRCASPGAAGQVHIGAPRRRTSMLVPVSGSSWVTHHMPLPDEVHAAARRRQVPLVRRRASHRSSTRDATRSAPPRYSLSRATPVPVQLDIGEDVELGSPSCTSQSTRCKSAGN